MIPIRQALDLLDSRTRRRLPLLLASFGLVAVFEAASIGLVFPLMLAVVDPAAVNEAPGFGWIRDVFGDADQGRLILVLGLAMGALFVAKNVLAALLIRWQFRVLFAAEAEAGTRLYLRYLKAPWHVIAGRNSSELIRNASTSLSHAFLSILIPALTVAAEVMLALAVLVVLMLVDPIVAVVGFGLSVAAGTMYYLTVHKTLERVGQAFQQASFGLLNQLKQGIGAGREIRVLGRTDEFVRKMRETRDVYAGAQARRGFLNQMPRYYLETTLVVAVLVTIGAMIALRGTGTVAPTLALFALAALRLLNSASRILASLQQTRVGLAPLRAVHQDLCSAPADGAAGDRKPAVGGTAVPEDKSGIVLSGVSFRYDSDRPAVTDISLRIPWGESLGVVGPSGSGKSTLIDLILGLLPPQEGRVEVDGGDLSEIGQEWRNRVGYVPQAIYLTDDTLRRNVALGLADHEIDDGALQRALGQANLSEFVAGLPKGMDTPIGELGTFLSGGQRQRIGIARALYHDPEVLVLDEATSALDNETESIVLGAVEALSGEKTVIVVAHRLSTVRRCDRLVVLGDGRLVDSGPFDDLASRSDRFARLVELGRLEPASNRISGS